MCSFLLEFGVPMILVRLIKPFVRKLYSKARIGNHLFDICPIQNGLQQGDVSPPLFFNLVSEMPLGRRD
jgi:hypothetical protein